MPYKIAVLKERAPHEYRVAVTPAVVKLLTSKGFKISVERNTGIYAGFSDEDYLVAGAYISGIPLEIASDADVILKVQPTPFEDKIGELYFAKKGALIIGLIGFDDQLLAREYEARGIIALNLQAVPDIPSVAPINAMPLQQSLLGYWAVIDGFHRLNKLPFMFTTAAGTIAPAVVAVLGTGPATVQAISTAKRLGAKTIAVSEDVLENLGVTTLSIREGSGILKQLFADSDLIIITQQLYLNPLINSSLNRASTNQPLIINIASGSRNMELSHSGIKIIQYNSFPKGLAHSASILYAKNLYYLLMRIYDQPCNRLNLSEELLRSLLLRSRPKTDH